MSSRSIPPTLPRNETQDVTAISGTIAKPPSTSSFGMALKAAARSLSHLRQNQTLDSLSDHLLADIGLTHFDVARAKHDNWPF